MNFIPSLSFQKFIQFFFFNPVPFWHIQWIQWWTWLLKPKKKYLRYVLQHFFFQKLIAFETLHFPVQCNFRVVFEFEFVRFFDCVTTVLNTKNWKGTLCHSLKNFWSNHNLLCKVDFRNMKILKCEHLNFTLYSVKYILKSAAVSSNINKCIGSSQCLKLWPQRRKQFAYVFVGLLWNNFNEVHKKLWTFF